MLEHAGVQPPDALGECRKKDTFSHVADDTPILEGTTARVTERVSRTGLPTLTSYPLLLSALTAQQTGLGTNPYEVEWIATRNGKVRTRIKREPRRSRYERVRGKILLTRPSLCVAASFLIVPDPFTPIPERR